MILVTDLKKKVIRIKIFNHLSPSELKIACLVCKEWHKTIRSSGTLHRSITIKIMPINDSPLSKHQKRFLRKYGRSFTKASVSGSFEDIALTQLLGPLKNLIHLSLNLPKAIADYEDPYWYENTFPFLEKISFESQLVEFPSRMLMRNMDPLEIEFLESYVLSAVECHKFSLWLTSRKRLKSLLNVQKLVLDFIITRNVQFKLKRIGINDSKKKNSPANLLKFFQSQDELEELYIHENRLPALLGQGVTEFVVFGLKHLHTLKMSLDVYHINDYENCTRQNTVLKNLQILNAEQDSADFFIPKFPELRTLTIQEFELCYRGLTTHLTKLEKLDIGFLDCACFPENCALPNVKEFRVGVLKTFDRLIDFFSQNQQFRIVLLKTSTNYEQALTDVLTTLSDLDILMIDRREYYEQQQIDLDKLKMINPKVKIQPHVLIPIQLRPIKYLHEVWTTADLRS